MALITRLSRLFQADMHAVLDRLEEPELLLRQAIRDMENETAGDRRALRTAEAEHQRLAARASQCEATQARTAGELELCFEAGNEPLARVLLRRRLQSERLQRHLAQQLELLESGISDQRRRLEERRRRLDELRDQAAVFEVAPNGADHAHEPEECNVSEADIELALLAEKQRRRRS
jgi:phage shock protein A